METLVSDKVLLLNKAKGHLRELASRGYSIDEAFKIVNREFFNVFERAV